MIFWRPAALRAAAFSGLFLAAPLLAEDHQLGRGLDVGAFNVAGYANLTVDAPASGQRSLTLDDLSLFISAHVTSFVNPFIEAELNDLDLAEFGGQDNGSRHQTVVLERIYDDIDLADSLTLRLGKMLAPVGEWNQIHAAPLVPTSVRPAVSYRNFSEYVSGLSLLYAEPGESAPEVQVYWQPADAFAESPTMPIQRRYTGIEGAHVSLPLSLLDQIGMTFERERLVAGQSQFLYGLDAHYTIGRLTLFTETTFSHFAGRDDAPLASRGRSEVGSYLLGSYAIDDRWSAYWWYEAFSDRGAREPAQDILTGIAFRPLPAVVGKLEFLTNVGGRPVNPTGLFASWSVLF